MNKRMFSPDRRVKTIAKSLRVPEQMWQILEKLAEKSNEGSTNAFVVYVLDRFLQNKVEEGSIKPPKDDLKAI